VRACGHFDTFGLKVGDPATFLKQIWARQSIHH